MEELSRQRATRVPATEGKGGSAGPSVKTELQRVKRQLRERDQELKKLKGEQASQKSFVDEEQEKKVRQLSN